jgi:hypothetical protein
MLAVTVKDTKKLIWKIFSVAQSVSALRLYFERGEGNLGPGGISMRSATNNVILKNETKTKTTDRNQKGQSFLVALDNSKYF